MNFRHPKNIRSYFYQIEACSIGSKNYGFSGNTKVKHSTNGHIHIDILKKEIKIQIDMFDKYGDYFSEKIFKEEQLLSYQKNTDLSSGSKYPVYHCILNSSEEFEIRVFEEHIHIFNSHHIVTTVYFKSHNIKIKPVKNFTELFKEHSRNFILVNGASKFNKIESKVSSAQNKIINWLSTMDEHNIRPDIDAIGSQLVKIPYFRFSTKPTIVMGTLIAFEFWKTVYNHGNRYLSEYQLTLQYQKIISHL